jgi:hypothetical protein
MNQTDLPSLYETAELMSANVNDVMNLWLSSGDVNLHVIKSDPKLAETGTQ